MKIMTISPMKMFFTKISASMFSTTEACFVSAFRHSKSRKYLNNVSSFVSCPNFRMLLFHVFTIAFEKFKIFYSVVCFNSIFVVNAFFFCQFSFKRLFHNVAMLKNSFAIYIYAKITKIRKAWSSFFKVSPVWRNKIIVSMSVKSSPVHRANMSVFLFENISTVFDFAYFIFHKTYYNTKGKRCQMLIYQF